MTDDIVEKSPGDAPAWLNADEANGWANGYNAAVREARAEILRLREQAGRAVDSNALTEQREKGLRANIDEIANHAYQISRIVSRGALRPEPALVDAPAAAVQGGARLIAANGDDRPFPNYAVMPDPTDEMLASPQFDAVWSVIKSWDVAVPEAYSGYCGANGSHVAMILRAIAAAPSPPSVKKDEVAVAVAAEREACAQVVRRVRDTWIKGDASSAIGNAFQRACDQALDGILGRARGEAG
jgi:hypothetical protein